MSHIPRIDDFRCHDQHLVHVLPGREDEAVEFAKEIQQSGHPVGLFIQGSEIDSWGFLRRATAIERFEFVDFSKTLKFTDIEPLRSARFLRIVGRKLGVDFSAFQRLETLYYQWSKESTGLESLACLKDVSLYEIGSQRNSEPLPLSSGVERLSIFNYQLESLSFLNTMDNLSQFKIERARNIAVFPRIAGLRKIEMKNVGREEFDYSSIPDESEDIEIDSCAPILSWDFVLSALNLRRLVIWKTKVPPISARVRKALERIEVVDFHRT